MSASIFAILLSVEAPAASLAFFTFVKVVCVALVETLLIPNIPFSFVPAQYTYLSEPNKNKLLLAIPATTKSFTVIPIGIYDVKS